ncbi:MAG: hypothetical protein Q7R30_12975 [Acidobacteriota bacterium]|nr:hypothetical protein [Acidobacteriota bacterium]
MNDQQIKRIIEDSYDESKEEGLSSIVSDFYSRKLLSTAIAAWVGGIMFLALSIFSAAQFFKSGETQQQIMYAVLFIVGMQGVVMMKIFAWQMVHRHSIKRDIKRLELRVVELCEALKTR